MRRFLLALAISSTIFGAIFGLLYFEVFNFLLADLELSPLVTHLLYGSKDIQLLLFVVNIQLVITEFSPKIFIGGQ
jgi:hypothetical protein